MTTSTDESRLCLDDDSLLRVLLIDDSPEDADILHETLGTYAAGVRIDLRWVSSLRSAVKELADNQYDIALLDLHMQGSSALETLQQFKTLCPAVPVVILTGLDDQDVAIEALKQGAQDYLVKGKPSAASICRVLKYAVERSRLEHDVRRVKANLELALSASGTGAWTWNARTNMIEVDERVRSIFSINDDEPCTLATYFSRVHADDRIAVKRAFVNWFRTTKEGNLQFRIIKPDGSTAYVSAIGKRVFGAERSTAVITGVCLDVTAAKAQEQNDRKLALLEQRQEFIALLAHDLRAPLVGAQRVLTLLADGKIGPVSEQQYQLLGVMVESNRSMMMMIENVLESYRYESGANRFKFESFDLCQLIQACCTHMLPIAEAGKIELSSSVPPAVSCYADYCSIYRVLVNLLSNAIKFTSPGGAIRVSLEKDDSFAVVTVADNGIGMNEDDLRQIFIPFWQSKSKFRQEGFGLGLHLCRTLIEANSGTISCRSELARGTTFEFRLPLAGQKDRSGVAKLSSTV